MPECLYGTRLSEGGRAIRCQKLSEAVGFIVSICDGHCLAHQKAGGPEVPVEDVPRLAEVIKGVLQARLIAGDGPEYQGPNPVDIRDASIRLNWLLSDEERVRLLHDICDSWLVGGHPVELMEEKLLVVARVWDLEHELEVWATGSMP